MKIGILQPGYLPWLGHFEQICRVDAFVFYDDVQYTKKDWRSRNRIKTPNGVAWLSVPVITGGARTQHIRHARIDNTQPWQRKHWRTIEQSYAAAPFFSQYAEGIRAFYERTWTHIAEFDIELTLHLCDCLGLRRETLRSSQLDLQEHDITRRVGEVCANLGADSLYDGQAARGLLDVEWLRERGISVEFQDYQHPVYEQQWGEFVSHLAIIDLLFNVGPRSRDILAGVGSGSQD